MCAMWLLCRGEELHASHRHVGRGLHHGRAVHPGTHPAGQLGAGADQQDSHSLRVHRRRGLYVLYYGTEIIT